MDDYFLIHVEYEGKEKIISHPFFGFSVRGAFGYALKQACGCDKDNCFFCKKRNSCAYFNVFKTAQIDAVSRRIKALPKPYRIASVFVDDMRLSFDLIVSKYAIAYLNHIKKALELIDCIGKGRKKGFGRISLTSIRIERRYFPKVSCSNAITISFLTPTIIVRDNSVLQKPSLYDVLVNAGRRYMFIYGKAIDFKGLKDALSSSSILKTNVHLVEFERWSSKRKKEKIVGIEGSITYSLPKNFDFWSLLSFASVFGVGKRVTAGMGEIEIS
jgi:CRISPR-associated endoribonuclease Cas6